MSRAATPLFPQAGAKGYELPVLRVVAPPFDREFGKQAEDKTPLGAEPLVLTEELEAEIRRESERLETAEPVEILRWATERFAPRFTMATAFGPEGMVL